MKLSKNWKRIFAGVMAAIMVFLSVDAGCMTALAAEIQELNNGKYAERPTGYLGLEHSWIDSNILEGEIYSYQELSEISTFTLEQNNEWDKYSNYFYYNQVSEEWQKVWDVLDLVCYEFLTNENDATSQIVDERICYFLNPVSVPEGIALEELEVQIELFFNSNPQYYFLNNMFLISGTETEEGISIESVILCVYEKFALGTERTEATDAFKSAIDAILSSDVLTNATSNPDKLRYVHDYIVTNVEYNHTITTDDDLTTDIDESIITDEEDEVALSQSAFSALCMDETVCAGYAEALQLLCNGLDVDTICVTSSDHQWNKVYINHTWYHVDPTWADMGEVNPIHYDYYLRSDEVYDSRYDAQRLSHKECDFYGNYLAACPLDATPVNDWEAPGTLPEITKQTDSPEFSVMKAGINEETGEQRYMIHMQPDSLIYNVSNPAQCYYTLDGTNPSIAKEKSFLFRSPIYVEGDYYIKVKVVQSGYLDSDVMIFTNQVDLPTVKTPVINDHFYNKMTLQWDEVEEASGYILNIYKGTETLDSNIIKTVAIENKETTSYVLDTSAYGAGENIFFEIYAYAGENREHVSDVARSQNYKTKDKAIDVGVKWHVTTIEGVEYLVIDVTENLVGDQQPADALWLWYYSDTTDVDPKRAFKVDMSDGVTYFMYKEGEYDISYKEIGYIFVTNEDKSSAFQENGFKVGGNYVEPQIESIPDVKLEEKDKKVTLKAQLKEESKMENFLYTYQWYIADDESSMGTAISGATKDTLTVWPGSFEEKYYYCEITIEYPVEGIEKQIFITDNGVESETGEKGHTRVLGELYGTDLHIADITNQVFTGGEIKPEILVTDVQTGEVLIAGEHYDVVYTNNINVGEVVGTVSFKGDYIDAPVATVKFNITPKSVKDAEDIILFDVEDKIYTGDAFQPKGEIVDTTRNVVLVEGVDYEIKYYANTNAGTANVTITFKGNYCDEKYIIFKINPKSCDGVVISNNVSQVYAGDAIIPTFLVVKDGEKTLAYETDYVFECSNNTNVGDATVKVVFVGNYTGELTTQFSITQKAADDLMIKEIEAFEYTGSAITPSLTIVYVNGASSVVLKEETDYTAVYEQNITCGKATVKLEFRGNYTGNREVTFDIVPKNADKLTYSEFKAYIYNGTEHKPRVSVMNGNLPLVEGRDFIVEYSDNVNAGMGKAIVRFEGFEGCSGNYAGTKELTFQIAPKFATECTVLLETLEDYTFTGTEFKPGVIVMDGEEELIERTEDMEDGEGDYIVTYSNNINAGEATVTVTFINNYTGESSQTFTINRKPITEADIEIEAIADQIYKGGMLLPENIIVKETVSDAEAAITLRPGVDYTVSAGAENTYVGTGVVEIHIELEGNYIYTGEDLEATFNIIPRDASNVIISPIAEQRFTGQEITPELEVKDGDIVLIPGVDYTVTYDNNVEVGTEASVSISFMGNFTGEDMSTTFTIIDPIPEYITSLVFHISETSGYISKITSGTTVYTLWNAINEQDYVSIFDKNGNGVSGDKTLATGMTAAILDDGLKVKQYTIIVTGDTNGDGKINITDMIAVKACSLKKSDLKGAYEKAADVNGDGKINITDFIKVKATTLRKDTITGVAVN